MKIRKNCQYYKNTEKYNSDISWNPIDIEDLAKKGEEEGICPFYLMQKRA